MPLLSKIKLLGLILFSVLALETIFILYSVNKLQNTSSELINHNMNMLNYAHEVKLSVVQVQQWLTDISATRGLDGLNDGFDEANNNAKLFKELIAKLSTIDPTNSQKYQAMLPIFDNYLMVGRKMAQSYIDEGPAGGNVMMASFDEAAASMSESVDTFLTEIIEKTALKGEHQLSLVDQLTLTAIFSSFAMVIVLVYAFFQMRLLLKFLGTDPEKLKLIVERVSEGEFFSDHSAKGGNSIYASIIDMQNKLAMVIQKDIQSIIDSANNGDLHNRIDLGNKKGFYKDLGSSVNNLVSTCQGVVDDTVRVFSALSKGDLSQKISREYKGDFQQLKSDANETIRQLSSTLNYDIQSMSDAIAKGDLNQRIEVSGKQGFYKEICSGINDLVATTSHFFDDATVTIEHISKGNLSTPMLTDYSGQFDDFKQNINKTTNQLNSVVVHINESFSTISNAANEISYGNTNLSQRTESQAASLEQIKANIEGLSEIVERNAENTNQASELASDTKENIDTGNQVMSKVSNAMSEINTSSKKIVEIISVIDEIAFQTNLLALNASVEAARAGEQGRGFAVVATEVRQLAGRSATAAKEIKELINDSVNKVEIGVDLVNQSTQTQTEIAESISNVETIITKVSNASNDQLTGINEVKQAVNRLDEDTIKNSTLAEQTSAVALSLIHQTEEMNNVMSFFATKKH